MKTPVITLGVFLSTATGSFCQPAILTQPQSRTNVAGTTATLWVEATGTPPLAPQWQKLGAAWSDLAGCTATNLRLTNVQASHAADYRVVITNADGAVTSEVARLTVLIPPRITPTTSFQHQAIHLGSNGSFTVAASGTPPISYQWLLDGATLPGQSSNSLSFRPVQFADEGDYTVVISNVAGTAVSEPARLWVVPPPSAYIREDFTNGTFRYPYYYLMPTNYNANRSYPLVCFFDGAYGDEIQFTNGVPGWVGFANFAANKAIASYRQQVRDPAIVAWPTLRAGQSTPWPVQYVWQATNLLDSLIRRFSVDTNRIYLVGISMGAAPAWDFAGLRPGFVAGGILTVGGQGSTPASALKDVPVWASCARDDEYNSLPDVQSLVESLRSAGGNPRYTEYSTGGHVTGAGMGMSTPVVIDWLLAQRRGVIPTCEPFLAITNPIAQGVLFTGARNCALDGTAAALGQPITQVHWKNYLNSAGGLAEGSNAWSVPSIPLVPGRTNLVGVIANTTSWAPAFGGNTTFSDSLTVIQSPIRATLAVQGTEAMLNWTGGGPPYRVQRATDLAAGDWTDLLPNATPPLLLPLPLPGGTGFYRIVGQ
jgi:poly(3-hydroxybutyrate) depolymerase